MPCLATYALRHRIGRAAEPFGSVADEWSA